MKKIIFLILLLIVFFTYGCSNENLTDDQIKGIVKPEIANFCKILDEQAYISECPTCWAYSDTSAQQFYDNILYNITQENNNYLVNVQLKIIYGRNTRSTDGKFKYNLDNKGNIIENANYSLYIDQCFSKNS